MDYQRTHNCGILRKEHIGQTVQLSAWVHRRRDHGGLIFIDLRDRFGLTQLVFDPKVNKEAHEEAQALRSEWVISIKGEVIPRTGSMANPNLATGDIEVEVAEISVLSKAKTPPFSICDEHITVNEELRLRYRYLDIRRGEVATRLEKRHQTMLAVRNHLSGHGFLEIQTPILGKSTPEGARDYLVPSRVHTGSFYALPQSPQLFKQLLMIGGMDRYFQLSTCFRDEDLRADRQPEFTQIDIEMSFGTPDTLFPIVEEMVQNLFKKVAHVEIPLPFRRLSYADCMDRYGTDKPDLRFGMELVTLDAIAERSTFSVFLEQLKGGGTIKGLCVKGGCTISRRMIDEYTAFVGKLGIKGLAWIKYQEGGLSSSIVKFFSEDLQKELIDTMQAEPGDLIFMIADHKKHALQGCDHLRRKLARDRGLIDPSHHEALWVTDFPLFSWNEEERHLEAEHHPFTGLREEDRDLLESQPTKVRSLSYDLVINGYECASGSQRIHDSELQEKIFSVLKLTPQEIEAKFGFFVEALQYGTPPHLGVALGLDRMVMILTGTDNIRDVIAFPKTQRASDLMMNAPSEVSKNQLNELELSHQESRLPV